MDVRFLPHLDGLAVQCKLALCSALQIVAYGPGEVVEAGMVVDITAHRPDASGFLLRLGEAAPHGGRESGETDNPGALHRAG